MSNYKKVLIQTLKSSGGGTSKSVRASPVSGQDLDTSMKAECSSSMRKNHPISSLFLLEAKPTDKEGTPFLYAHYNTQYKVISEQEAKEFLLGLRITIL